MKRVKGTSTVEVARPRAGAAPHGRAQGLVKDDSGSTSLETALLLGVIAIPGYIVIRLGLSLLVAHYQMMTTVNSMPFP